jgi:glycerate 2-kinase
MKILIAPDSFKGSLPATAVAAALARGLRASTSDHDIQELPLADGGEGTLDVLERVGFTLIWADAVDAWGAPIRARYAVREGHVVIEAAQAFGFKTDARPSDALSASSFGLGLLVKRALGEQPHTLSLAVGGTAGTDAGTGMLHALGARFLDHNGQLARPGGGGLAQVATIDLTGLDPGLQGVRIEVLTDVANPLLGDRGAARVFSPQKGADSPGVSLLEAGLAHIAHLVGGAKMSEPGAGAGGGLAWGAMVWLGATTRSGALALMDMAGFSDALRGVDLVVTGEGSFDDQSLSGKITGAVIREAVQATGKVVVVCGVAKATSTPDSVSVVEISQWASSTSESIARTEELLVRAGFELGNSLSTG